MADYQLPEIQRVPLEDLVLQVAPVPPCPPAPRIANTEGSVQSMSPYERLGDV